VDLNLLLVLRMLLETASVSETARRLNSTQPSISRMLDPLLVKSSNAMIRTARANALQPVLNQLLELLQTVYQTPADYQLAHERRTCVIGANDSLQAIFAAPLITTLRELAPHAQVRFKPVPYPNMLRSLLDGEVDLLLAMTEEEDPAFRSRALFRSGFCCMCSVDNPAVGATTSIGAIAALPYLDVSHMGQVSAMTQAIFLAAGHRKNTVAAMSSFLAAPSVIAGGLPGALLPGAHPGARQGRQAGGPDRRDPTPHGADDLAQHHPFRCVHGHRALAAPCERLPGERRIHGQIGVKRLSGKRWQLFLL
jgi:LysR family transcriptional activator of mexEF-oprN operon